MVAVGDVQAGAVKWFKRISRGSAVLWCSTLKRHYNSRELQGAAGLGAIQFGRPSGSSYASTCLPLAMTRPDSYLCQPTADCPVSR